MMEAKAEISESLDAGQSAQSITIGYPSMRLTLEFEGVRPLKEEERKSLVDAMWMAFVNGVQAKCVELELVEGIFVPWEGAEVMGADWR